jgi:tetratricopeptide (TPR) repeat protein
VLREGIDRVHALPPGKRKTLAVRLAHFGRFLIEHGGASRLGAPHAQDAEEALRNAHAIYSTDFAPGYWRKRDVAVILGRHLWRQGRFDEAEGFITEGCDLWIALGPSNRNALSAWSFLVDFYAAWGAHSERLVPRLQNVLDSDASGETLHAWASRVVIRPNLAKPLYERSLEALRRAERRTPDDAQVLRSIGAAHFRLGDAEIALRLLKQADALHSAQAAGGVPEDVAFIAMSLHQLGRADEALAAFDRMCALLGDDHPDDGVAKQLKAEAERLLQSTCPP